MTVLIREGVTDPVGGMVVAGRRFSVLDWWDLLTGRSWRDSRVPVCAQYAFRSGLNGLPSDDAVLYGKIEHLGHLVHASEILLVMGLAETEIKF
jgi:hypothetical protein